MTPLKYVISHNEQISIYFAIKEGDGGSHDDDKDAYMYMDI